MQKFEKPHISITVLLPLDLVKQLKKRGKLSEIIRGMLEKQIKKD